MADCNCIESHYNERVITLIKSTFYYEETTKKQLISFIAKAKQLSFGQEGQKFEKSFAAWQGRRYCIFVNSGSSANLALIRSLLNLGRLKKGDMIGFSALTWSTNVMPLIELGLTPVPIDIELATLNISSATLQETLKKYNLHALFLTNLLGFCSDIDVIADICKKQNILLLEDNCESLGSVYNGKKLGNFGLASTFSFYVGHHMSTVEGGAICTDDEELATMFAIVRAHGWDRNITNAKQQAIRKQFRINSTFYSRYTFYDLGYNFRPTEIAGFLGNVQLQYLPEIIQKREKNFLTIAPVLNNETVYYPLRWQHMDIVSNFAIPVICKTKKQRDLLVQTCNQRVEIRPIVAGDITQQPFFKKYIRKQFALPNTRYIHTHGLYFGNNPELTKQEVCTLLAIFAPSYEKTV